jgi:hypothetical protein
MQDRTLLRIALFCGLVGVAALFLTTRRIEVTTRPIEELSLLQDEDVAIRGIVDDVEHRKGLTVLRVGYPAQMTVVLFERIDVQRGERVLVTGTLKEYQGEMEIVGDRLIVESD